MPPDLVTGFTIFALVAIAVMLFIGVQARIVTEQVKKCVFRSNVTTRFGIVTADSGGS